jgi:hypothetical protein
MRLASATEIISAAGFVDGFVLMMQNPDRANVCAA